MLYLNCFNMYIKRNVKRNYLLKGHFLLKILDYRQNTLNSIKAQLLLKETCLLLLIAIVFLV